MKIGIDLGTSYSSVAAEINGKIEMIKVSTGASAFGDSYSLPTAVYMDKECILLGQAALAKRKISPSCFKGEFKRDMGTTTPYILSGEEYLPEQLYTEIFLYFKDQAVKQTGEKVEKVYLTHPANYGNNKKRLIEKAANNAGMFDIVLVDEPTAAAAGYSEKNKITDGDILLVYDLGGGTFDTAIIKKTSKGYVHLTEPLGISYCGGVDFDHAIFDDIVQKMSQDDNFDMERLTKDKRFTTSLSEICIQIKHQMSQAQSHTEPIAAGYDYFDYTITRQEFEDMIRPLIANTCEKVKDIIKNSGLSVSDIDRVLLVGGSSRVPLVQKMVCDTLKKDVCFDADPELAVCQGAASLGITKKQDDILHENKNQAQDKNPEIEKLKEKINNVFGRKVVNGEPKKEERSTLEKEKAVEYSGRMKEIAGDVITGSFASDGDWFYYIEPRDNFALYKIKIDGTQKTKLGKNIAESPVSAEGDFVYYNVRDMKENLNNVYRIKKDGTGEMRIGKEYTFREAKDYVIKDGWIYYVNSFRRLRKIHTDGTCMEPVGNDKYAGPIAVEGDFIYYTCSSNNMEDEIICKINIDGTKRTEICKKKAKVKAVFDNWIYYEDAARDLWKIRMDGMGNSKISNGFGIDRISIINGWLYYKNNNLIYRMHPEKPGTQEVSYDMMIQAIHAAKFDSICSLLFSEK